MRRRLTAFLITTLLVALLLSACFAAPGGADVNQNGTDNAPDADQLDSNLEITPEQYDIWVGNQICVLNQYGDIIKKGNWQEIEEWRSGTPVAQSGDDAYANALYDVATGELQCYIYTRRGELVQTDYGQEYRYETALFGQDGTQLTDWGEYNYLAAFGDWVARVLHDHSSVDTYRIVSDLWNFKTGESCALQNENYYPMLIGMDGSVFEVVADYNTGVTICKYDTQANVIDTAEYPKASYYELAEQHIIIVYDYDGDVTYTAIDRNLQEQPLPEMYRYLQQFPHGFVTYEDDHVVIITWWEDYQSKCTLFNRITGEPTIENANYLGYLDTKDGVDRYLMLDWDTIKIVDIEGAVLNANNDVIVSSALVSGNGMIVYTLHDYVSCGLMDSEFNIILDAESPVERSSIWLTEIEGFINTELVAFARFGQGQTLIDIYGVNGEMIIDNVASVHAVGPDRIAITRGNDYGLVDYQGNWIQKYSRFSEWIDD